jgi:hypothetical protein
VHVTEAENQEPSASAFTLEPEGMGINLPDGRSVAVFPGVRAADGHHVYGVESVNADGEVSRMAWTEEGAVALHQLLGGAIERARDAEVQKMIARVMVRTGDEEAQEIAVHPWQWRLLPAHADKEDGSVS